jgi:hypothetical protein
VLADAEVKHWVTYIIMLDELAAVTGEHTAKHALVLGETDVFALLVLDVDVEGLALEEELEIAVVLQDGVCGGAVQHALEGSAPRLDEIGLEAADGLLLGRRGDDDARAVVVQLRVQPEEVAVAARDGELGVAVALGRRLGRDRVLCVGARQVADLVGVADGDVERGLGRLLDADAGLGLAMRRCGRRRLDGRGDSGAGSAHVVIVVVEIDRVHHVAQRRRRGAGGLAGIVRRGGLLLRRRGSIDVGRRRGRGASQRAQGIVYGLELGRLQAMLAPAGATKGGRARGSRGRGRRVGVGGGLGRRRLDV